MAKKGRKGKDKQREDDVIVDDPRFAAMHTAPVRAILWLVMHRNAQRLTSAAGCVVLAGCRVAESSCSRSSRRTRTSSWWTSASRPCSRTRGSRRRSVSLPRRRCCRCEAQRDATSDLCLLLSVRVRELAIRCAAKYDKYGRKAKKPAKSELGDMYKLEQSAEERLEYLNRLARGEIEESGSDSDDLSDSEQRAKAKKAGGEDEDEDASDVDHGEELSADEEEEEEEDSDEYDSITSEDERNTISLLEISKVREGVAGGRGECWMN